MNELASLFCLTTDNSKYSHYEQVRTLLEKGARFVQLRTKLLSHNELLDQINLVFPYVQEYGANLIINDYIEIAQHHSISGVHLGSNDCCVVQARKQLGANAIIGSTVHNLEDAIKVKKLGICNYVGLGPFRKSKTKSDLDPILSEEMIFEILEVLSGIPVYLIGGIELSDCELVARYGLAGIAVCSALSEANDCASNVNEFINQLSLEKRAVA